MRTILVTAVLAGIFAPAAMAEGEVRPERGRQRPEGKDGAKHGEKGMRGRPTFGASEEMFKRMDKDRDGNITKEELFSAQRMERLPKEKRDKIFARLDRDGDQMISKVEIREVRRDAVRRAKGAFRHLDEDKSGGLSFAEFSKGEFLGKLPEEKRRQIFQRMDTDGNGEINAEDRPKGPPRRKP